MQKSFHHTIKCVLHNKLHLIVLICFGRGHERPTATNALGWTTSPTAVPAGSHPNPKRLFPLSSAKKKKKCWKYFIQAMKRMQHKDRLKNSKLRYITSTGTDSKTRNAVVSCLAKCLCVYACAHIFLYFFLTIIYHLKAVVRGPSLERQHEFFFSLKKTNKTKPKAQVMPGYNTEPYGALLLQPLWGIFLFFLINDISQLKTVYKFVIRVPPKYITHFREGNRLV